jgi:hypothetical protein
MRKISPDKTSIDYFQNFPSRQRGLTNRFGIRIMEDHCVAVVKIGDGHPFVFGKEYPLPSGLETLPGNLKILIDDYVLHYPGSELIEVLVGWKSFQEALDSSPDMELVQA